MLQRVHISCHPFIFINFLMISFSSIINQLHKQSSLALSMLAVAPSYQTYDLLLDFWRYRLYSMPSLGASLISWFTTIYDCFFHFHLWVYNFNIGICLLRTFFHKLYTFIPGICPAVIITLSTFEFTLIHQYSYLLKLLFHHYASYGLHFFDLVVSLSFHHYWAKLDNISNNPNIIKNNFLIINKTPIFINFNVKALIQR